jgi:hypothetical protein
MVKESIVIILHLQWQNLAFDKVIEVLQVAHQVFGDIKIHHGVARWSGGCL